MRSVLAPCRMRDKGELRQERAIVCIHAIAQDVVRRHIVVRPRGLVQRFVQDARRSLAFPLALAASLLLTLGWAAREWTWRQRWSSTSAEVTQLRSALTAERSRTQELVDRLARTEEELSRVRTALAQLEESLDLLHDPRLQLVTLSHPQRAQPAVAHVLLSPESGKALFSAVNLPPLPGDRTYELWWITADEGPINAGLFQPDPTGRARLEPQLPMGKGKIQAAAVTIEPAAGVPKPTGPMVLLGKL